MKGYYSLGLTGYEVSINSDGESVTWIYVGSNREQVSHRAKIYYTKGGRAYFNIPGRRIHLDLCLRADI